MTVRVMMVTLILILVFIVIVMCARHCGCQRVNKTLHSRNLGGKNSNLAIEQSQVRQ